MLMVFATCLTRTALVVRGGLFALICLSTDGAVAQPLTIKGIGTDRASFTYHGEPLLSFGGLSDYMFWFADDAYDYRLWADWAANHGMNHVRAYPPLSWKHSVLISEANGGSAANVRLPYRVVAGSIARGDPQFDLLQFDDQYWKRFRQRLEYLEDKGIIVHLLMWNNWQLRDSDTDRGNNYDWDGHLFNPVNNVNDFTKYLSTSNRTDMFHSVFDGRTDLADAQRAYFTKLIEETYDLDNVYYDLVHELGGPHFPDSWGKTQVWIKSMVDAMEARWDDLRAQRPLIIGMDVGQLSATQRNWIFSQPYFDVLIDGKKHTVADAKSWRQKYNKPYIPQEAWDDNGVKYSYGDASQRVHIRKYFWKFMMARAQQMDLYTRRPPSNENPKRFDYDPRGHNAFEDDARVLRATWENVQDYPNLRLGGRIESRETTNHKYLLSSNREALVYISSETGEKDRQMSGIDITIVGTKLADGTYTVDVIKPSQHSNNGLWRRTTNVAVKNGGLTITLPAKFTDDIAVHIF